MSISRLFKGIGFDDFMGETTSDEKGFFYVSGSNAEISDIDPKFNIYHDCNDWYWVSDYLTLLGLLRMS